MNYFQLYKTVRQILQQTQRNKNHNLKKNQKLDSNWKKNGQIICILNQLFPVLFEEKCAIPYIIKMLQVFWHK